MQTNPVDPIRSWVMAYVDGFRPTEEELPAPLALKLEHSRRVAQQARDIARDLGWSPEEVSMAEALGWLHDVGRFSQFAEFGHFHDATSIDHGLRGFEIVQASDLLTFLPETHRPCLLAGIRWHNAKIIPPTTTDECRPLLQLIRDADKLDIFRVVMAGLAKDGFQELANMLPHIHLQGPVNPALLREICTQHNAPIDRVHSLADFLLLQASWVYDLHYLPTRERVRHGRILDTFSTYLPDDPATQEALDEMRAYLSDGKEKESRRPMETAP